MSRPIPSNIEKKIPPNQFIVSKTDLKGIITYCNEIFIDIVGGTEEQLLGQPHNVVRHPDMPKTVFKILWGHLQKKKEVFAFVKNLCFDGSYYWVFANVSPSYDGNGNIVGYYSVRRQMADALIPVVEELYSKLLAAEKAGGLEAGEKALNTILEDQGMNYDEFIMHIARS